MKVVVAYAKKSESAYSQGIFLFLFLFFVLQIIVLRYEQCI